MPEPKINSISQMFPPKPKWPLTNIPDLSGRVIVVTGGNSGIGYETVAELLRHKAKVYLATRSKERGEKAIAELRKLPNVTGTVEFIQLDVGDLRSIEKFAKEMKSREKQIDVLFNNAGVMLEDVTSKTAQGYESHIGINGLGTHYVTLQLLPLLKAAGAAHPNEPARVVFTSSYLHNTTVPKGFDPEDPSGLNTRRPFGVTPALRCYGVSKFCNILSSRVFQRKYGGDNIVFTSVHPGVVRTKLLDGADGMFGALKDNLMSIMLIDPEKGAYTQLYAAFGPDGLVGGAYFVPYGRRCATIKQGDDTQVQDTFDRWCEEQIAKHAA
ncbi:hypothetical protein MCUN1_003716 [Malassezia cuniculi]|uniref:NAD(P)-binding protein n=1 Tax=Malassezia cuniculi TaxID=948313 RepID=A0AAF0JDD6_9BASI|nr:hypothetical protein MCUN1_003716 [Malassezia cuniculi]